MQLRFRALIVRAHLEGQGLSELHAAKALPEGWGRAQRQSCLGLHAPQALRACYHHSLQSPAKLSVGSSSLFAVHRLPDRSSLMIAYVLCCMQLLSIIILQATRAL